LGTILGTRHSQNAAQHDVHDKAAQTNIGWILLRETEKDQRRIAQKNIIELENSNRIQIDLGWHQSSGPIQTS
jgi:hypothetical protein